MGKMGRISVAVAVGLLFFGCAHVAFAAEKVSAYTTLEEPLAKELFDEFERETAIKVEWERLSSGEVVVRLEAEKNNPQASIWVGGVGTQHIEAKDKGLTTPFNSVELNTIPERYRDKEKFWTGLYIGPISFCMNTKRAKEHKLSMPKRWTDLLKPEYAKKVRVAHPSTSGTAYNMITTVVRIFDGDEDKAFEFLKKLNDAIDQYAESGSTPSKNCAIGEVPIAIGYLHDQVKLKKEGAPIDIIVPRDGTGYETASMSLINGGQDMVNAKRLYNWVLGGKSMEIISKWYVIPLSSQAKPTQTGYSINAMKTVAQNDVWDAANKVRLIERWNREIGGEYKE